MAVRIGYLSKNPSGNCILPRIEQAEIHPLDTPELSKLLAFLKGHEHEALIVTAILHRIAVRRTAGADLGFRGL